MGVFVSQGCPGVLGMGSLNHFVLSSICMQANKTNMYWELFHLMYCFFIWYSTVRHWPFFPLIYLACLPFLLFPYFNSQWVTLWLWTPQHEPNRPFYSLVVLFPPLIVCGFALTVCEWPSSFLWRHAILTFVFPFLQLSFQHHSFLAPLNRLWVSLPSLVVFSRFSRGCPHDAMR